VLGCGYRGRASQSMQSVIDCLADQAVGSQATVLVCVDIQDPTNLGAILRTADAFGVTAVVLAGNCADPFSRRVLRVSMGATFQLILIQTDDLAGVLTALRHRCQMKLVAAVASNAGEPLERVDRDSRVALLLGNESRGLSDEWIRLCDRQVTIPMHSHADSLNVAVATGILLYHYCTPALSRDFGVRQEASGASHL
jgi:tRNA G18 (ribose-2'-O)-methylase SpoU